jgi:periplasmic protein TonB
VTLTLGRRAAPVAYGISLALHAALFAVLLRVHPRPERRATPVEVEIVETRPPPPAPLPAAEPPPPAPAPPPRPLPRPRRIAAAPPVPLPRDAPPPPPRAEAAPPPPNAPPPANAKPGPVRIGVSMSSTTTAGGEAAPVGNTLYGRPAGRAEDPATAKPYRSEKYVAPTQVTTLPEPLGCDIPREAYPEEAKRLGLEGDVRLRLAVDEEGRVVDVKVLKDPGHGLADAAVRNVKRYCRFRPARRNAEAVATEIPFTLHFELQ